MKMILSIILAAALLTPSAVRDDDGHRLVKLWQSFNDYISQDRPQKAVKALEEIKSEAAAKRLPWDFYDAAQRYVSVASSRNWKLSDSLRVKFEEEIVSFNYPVVSFYYSIMYGTSPDAAFDAALAAEKRLRASFNPEFYTRDYRLSSLDYAEFLIPRISTDYEYVLWSAARPGGAAQPRARALLAAELRDAYPKAAILEFQNCLSDTSSDSLDAALTAYAGKYDGRAASLLAREELLRRGYSELTCREDASSEEFKALRAQCEKFEKDRAQYTGEEKALAKCCTVVKGLIDILDSKDMSVSVRDGLLSVVTRNLSSVNVSIDNVFRTTLQNEKQSYYVQDTLTLELPQFNDGEYTVKCTSGKESCEARYTRHSISAAVRRSAEGCALYAAGYFTGEPVQKARVIISINGSDICTVENFHFNGFTPFTSEMSRAINGKKRCTLRCEYTDASGRLRSSETVSIPEQISNEPPQVYDRGSIFLDRMAYHPGDTASFKVLCYTSDGIPFSEGREISIEVLNASGKTIATKRLKTNAFGSAAGAVVLERGERNGSYNIVANAGGRALCSAYVQVDDFVLPTFDISFDKNEELWLGGDSVRVSGRITSYSGHPLGSAAAAATVTRWGETVAQIPLVLSSDGAFSFIFKSEPQQYATYTVTVKVTDTTGETLESSAWLPVHDAIDLNVSLQNSVEANVAAAEGMKGNPQIVDSDTALVHFGVLNRENLKLSYTLRRDGRDVLSAEAAPGETAAIPLQGPSGLYQLLVRASAATLAGKEIKSERTLQVLKLSAADSALDAPVENVFRLIPDSKDILLQMGAASGPVWAVLDITGAGGRVVLSEIVKLTGERGKEGSLKLLRYAHRPEWGPDVTLHAAYFRRSNFYTFEQSITRTPEVCKLPLAFSLFEDRTLPGHEYTFTFRTDPGVECLAAVFDKSTETVRPNRWSPLRSRSVEAPSSYYASRCGSDKTQWGRVMVRGMAMNSKVAAASADMVEADMAVQEEAIPFQLADNAGGPEPDVAEVKVREDFASTLAFEPFLRSDASGNVALKFRTADKLGTFFVQIFAHDKTLRSAVERREMMVTLPVKVSLAEPQVLYAGDKYVCRVGLSSMADAPVSGRVRLTAYDGTDYRTAPVLMRGFQDATVAPGENISIAFPINIQHPGDLGLLASFESDFNDAVFVTVPVYAGEQTLTEAHSAIVRSGADVQGMIQELKARFVSGQDGIEVTEKSLLQMVREAIPAQIRPDARDIVTLSGSLTSALLASWSGKTPDESGKSPEVEMLEKKIMACRNADGGFGWMEGMSSSPILTAAVLQRFHLLRSRGLDSGAPLLLDAIPAAVAFLDNSFFKGEQLPWWRGSVSMEEYLMVRAMYPEVPFEVKGIDAKRMKTFRKEAKAYLAPSKERGLNGAILRKARRLMTLELLTKDKYIDGCSVPVKYPDQLKSWGISLSAKKLEGSLVKDTASLLEYAVEHSSGGCYFPNAVMPLRGLLDSELAAHSLLCDILRDSPVDGSSEIADGIRLWMMVQKETQQWGDDPAFVEAIASVLDGSPEVLDTRVVIASRTYTKPFAEIVPTGNGFTLECEYSINGKALNDGDTLHIGDKVRATYRIWNAENRSFVRLSAPRPACLRPAQQLSGPMWSWRYQSYRNVLSDRTEFWYEVYPEEKTTVTEDLLVTQEGVFNCPAPVIESLYAPHYRANDKTHFFNI